MGNKRKAPIEISKKDFKKMGYRLVDRIAAFIATIDERQVTTGETAQQLQKVIGNRRLPAGGKAPGEILERATSLLTTHSLFNGHPKFLGYITSSAAPLGALADLLAAAVNPNVGAQVLSPVATEIEKQTVKWLAEFIGLSPAYGGLLVSGGNMANFTGFLAGRTVKAPKSIRQEGMSMATSKLTIYCSKTTHTWVEKAAVLFGFGTDAIRWVPADKHQKMEITILEEMIRSDLDKGWQPIMVIGTAGDVSTGAVDDLRSIGAICKKFNLWFHVDGAYGIPAAVVPGFRKLFLGIEEADSIALDPHKWLYSPLEAGCTLVKDPNHLIETFSSHPVYYNFSNGDPLTQNYYEYGLQNSRGFRALKVWLCLQQVGRKGYIKMIGDDIKLSRLLYDLADRHKELEAVSNNLSITTFRYVPKDINYEKPGILEYLNDLNEKLLNELQARGDVFLSNALVQGKYCLRACIVNFRTDENDIREIIAVIVKQGRKIYQQLK